VASRRPAKQLQGSRLVAPTGPTSCRFTEVVEGRLLGLLWPLGPLVARRLQEMFEPSQISGGLALEQPGHQRTNPGGDGDLTSQ
jgi:hypothetical protein